MIAFVIGLVGLAVILTIAWGARRRWPKTDRQPPVSVVVCARDEEATIVDCLMALGAQDYPLDRYEIIVVNHLSRDSTGEAIEEYADGAPVPVRVIHLMEEDPELPGKQHALAVALDHVKTDFVLQTDADCIVPESWVSTLMSYFTDEVDAVGGMVTVASNGPPRSVVGHLQYVDHRYYLGMLSGISGLFAPGPDGRRITDRLPSAFHRAVRYLKPSALIGNNQAFRMEAYREVGGYRALGPSFVEDYALMDKIMKRGKGYLALVLDPAGKVTTTPETSFRALWRQKRRWATGTNHINPLSAFLFVMIILLRIVLPWLVFINPVGTLVGLGLVAVGDMAVIVQMRRYGGEPLKLRHFLFQELYLIALNNALLLASAVGWPVFWKGRRYRPGIWHPRS